jgi:hypothetical protein
MAFTAAHHLDFAWRVLAKAVATATHHHRAAVTTASTAAHPAAKAQSSAERREPIVRGLSSAFADLHFGVVWLRFVALSSTGYFAVEKTNNKAEKGHIMSKGGSSGGGKGGGGGEGSSGSSGGGKGNGGNWPSTTGKPSGGGRGNNPPSK